MTPKSHSFILLALSLIIHQISFGQFDLTVASSDENIDYYSTNYLRFDNYAYQSSVKTVTLHPKGWPLSPPVIQLSEQVPLILEFDVLDSALGNYMYTLIHCDHNWEKSQLENQEYIIGAPTDFISEYDYSRNTYQKYIHYSLEFPNMNMEITKSGNYLLKVFDSENPDRLVLTRRFCVAENIIGMNVEIHQPTMVTQRYTHQEIDFELNPTNYDVTNPYEDLHVIILQNHNWTTALEELPPRFIKSSSLDFDYDGENAMLGLNEFRLLDIKNTRFTGRGVERVTYGNKENHAYLEQNESRLSKIYLQIPDLNGWFYIKNDWLDTEGTVDADYVHTHFSLKSNFPLENGDVYVFGALTDWQIQKEAKMTYDQIALEYQANLYLKQGMYSYLYAVVSDGSQKPDLMQFEGTHFQTENEYAILVYHRSLGYDYDRLLAYKVIEHNKSSISKLFGL